MGKELEEVISNGLLSYEEDGLNLHLFIERINHYDLILMINDIYISEICKKSKPIRFDITMRRNESLLNDVQNMMINNRYTYISQNVEMILSHDTKNVIRTFEDKNLVMRPINSDELEIILKIWHDNLDPMINEIPQLEDMANNQANIYVILYKNKVVGGVRLIHRGNRIYVEQVAIDKSNQGKGFGVSILSFIKSENPAKDIGLWVSKDNIRAVKLYEKFGFEYTNKISLQYLMEETL